MSKVSRDSPVGDLLFSKEILRGDGLIKAGTGGSASGCLCILSKRCSYLKREPLIYMTARGTFMASVRKHPFAFCLFITANILWHAFPFWVFFLWGERGINCLWCNIYAVAAAICSVVCLFKEEKEKTFSWGNGICKHKGQNPFCSTVLFWMAQSRPLVGWVLNPCCMHIILKARARPYERCSHQIPSLFTGLGSDGPTCIRNFVGACLIRHYAPQRFTPCSRTSGTAPSHRMHCQSFRHSFIGRGSLQSMVSVGFALPGTRAHPAQVNNLVRSVFTRTHKHPTNVCSNISDATTYNWVAAFESNNSSTT